MFNILGQDKLKSLFKSSLKKNMVSHSYLIEGEEGLGKMEMAKFISASLLCKNITLQEACGICSSCRKIINDNHPDVRIIDNKTVKIDDIRGAIKEVYKKPYEGSKKVLIINNFETSTIESQNAILKTLEEPPKTAILILLAKHTMSILDTIKSRCQKLKMLRIDTSLLKEYLLENGVTEGIASFASMYSEGNLKVAKKACGKEFLDLRDNILRISLGIFKETKYNGIKYSEELSKYKDNIDDIFNIITSIYRDIIMLKVGNNNKIINSDKTDILIEESYKLSYNKLEKAIKRINSARDSINRDTNFQLTIEVMMIGIQDGR